MPPDKLAKAIALSRIRNILDIAGSIWGIVFFWLLLARAAGPGWRAGRRGFRASDGFRELIFFAAFFIISTLASLPLDWIGHHYERELTGSACRGGEAGLATRRRRWD